MSVTFGRTKTLDIICDVDLFEEIEQLPGVVCCDVKIRGPYRAACTVVYDPLVTDLSALQPAIRELANST